MNGVDFRNRSTIKKLIQYTFSLKENEVYCPGCRKIYPDYPEHHCSECGTFWLNFKSQKDNPIIEIEEE